MVSFIGQLKPKYTEKKIDLQQVTSKLYHISIEYNYSCITNIENKSQATKQCSNSQMGVLVYKWVIIVVLLSVVCICNPTTMQ